MVHKNTFQQTRVRVSRIKQAFIWLVIPEWKPNPNKEIAFPLEDIPESIRPQIKVGTELLAYVTLNASKVSELHLERFTLHKKR